MALHTFIRYWVGDIKLMTVYHHIYFYNLDTKSFPKKHHVVYRILYNEFFVSVESVETVDWDLEKRNSTVHCVVCRIPGAPFY